MSKKTAIARAMTRIVVVNFSGNTGKTTMVRHLLRPMFPAAELIRIETINSSGSSEADIEVNGRAFDEVAKLLFAADTDKIVDIGASNIELVKASLRRLGDAHEEVDMWVVPCMPNTKMLKDTIATVAELIDLGVEPSRIKLLKNKVLDIDTMDNDFAALAAAAAHYGVTLVDNPVLELDVYAELDHKPGSMDDIVADLTDYKAKMLEAKRAGSEAEAAESVEAEFRRKNAKQAMRNLAKVRAELFGIEAQAKAA